MLIVYTCFHNYRTAKVISPASLVAITAAGSKISQVKYYM